MKRRIALLLGVVMLGLVSAYLVAFGSSVRTGPLAVALLVGFVLSAILFVIGGFADSISVGDRTVPWNALVGVGDITLASVVTLSAVRSALVDGGTAAWLFAAAMLGGGPSLALIGVQTARDSHHVDLEATPSSRRLVAIVALVAISAGIGVAVATSL
ncbi:hypothetical protein [Natrinema limicola]|uniref:Uncharacterized protein n=1 Tax=Natrinema limicola JCM 13563 TaxID=1230457 RepID=M0CKS8_9EURY|nr:hypothetical protein [Natrinema limicola]ELZ23238.1 hypothetical protein C476_05183 [Natrinema limicola JCM 13563]